MGLDPVALFALRRGIEESRLNRQTTAQRWFQIATCAAPDDPRIVAQAISGDAERQARESRRALCLDPLSSDLLERTGQAVAEIGGMAAAVSWFRRALLVAPDAAIQAASILADMLGRAGKAGQAYPLSWWAAQKVPGNLGVQICLATVAGALGRDERAADAFDVAARIQPLSVEIAVAAVHAARRAGRGPEAWRFARRAALLTPDQKRVPELLAQGTERPDGMSSARQWARRAVVAEPSVTPTWNVLAQVCQGEGDFAGSLRAGQRMLLLSPVDRAAGRIVTLGAATLSRFDLARRTARIILAAHPGEPEVTHQRAQVEKAVGDLARGWDLDFARTTGPRFHRTRGLPPRQSADAFPGDGLLVASEQGIGDELLFLSCLPDLLVDCPRPVVEADIRFHPLLARSFPGLALIDRQARSDAGGVVFDYRDVVADRGLVAHIQAGDLPARYRRDRSRPSTRAGYLRADQDRVDLWRRRLEQTAEPGVLTVGLCWRSMLSSGIRSLYYTTLDGMLPILRLPRIRFVCLQYDDCAAELESLRRDHGIDIWLPEDLDQRTDLDGVAALMAALDVVVSTATSVCVLAAAIGRPTLRLAPSFYSISDDRDFFFPTMIPTARRTETLDLTVAIARAAEMLVQWPRTSS